MITVTQAGNELSDKMLYHHAASSAYKLQLLPSDSSHVAWNKFQTSQGFVECYSVHGMAFTHLLWYDVRKSQSKLCSLQISPGSTCSMLIIDIIFS